MKKIFILLGVAFYSSVLLSQTSDSQFTLSLSEVVSEIENRYNITIRDPEKLVEGKNLTYALWRFRPELAITLENVFTPLDLFAQKEGEAKYKLKKYQYFRLSLEEGQEKLAQLSSLYDDKTSWENRKAELQQCILEVLELNVLPPAPNSKPIITNKRKMNGYTIENVALETMPGLYVCASVYKPSKAKNKVPIILCPNGHFSEGRYRPNQQKRCATLARMGAIAVSYDVFAYGESLLQFEAEDHHSSLAMRIQALNSVRLLDYLLVLPEADPERVGITGGSGGGSQTILISAIDPRIKVSAPVVMLSCIHSGGCPCESGMPIHLCGEGTNNVELAGIFAPNPQLVISDGGDWTANVPDVEFPFLQQIYSFYNKTENVENKHFPEEGHNYGHSKRFAMYPFMAKQLALNLSSIKDKSGNIDESACTLEEEKEMYAFGYEGELLPGNAIHSMEELVQLIQEFQTINEEE